MYYVKTFLLGLLAVLAIPFWFVAMPFIVIYLIGEYVRLNHEDNQARKLKGDK